MLVEIQLVANWHCHGLRKATGTPTEVKKGKNQFQGHMCTHKQFPSVDSVCFHVGQIGLAHEKKKKKSPSTPRNLQLHPAELTHHATWHPCLLLFQHLLCFKTHQRPSCAVIAFQSILLPLVATLQRQGMPIGFAIKMERLTCRNDAWRCAKWGKKKRKKCET